MSENFGISLRKLRMMESAGALNLNPPKERGQVAKIKYYLKKGKSITTENFVRLILEPALFEELGEYRLKAKQQLAALGDVKGTAPQNTRGMNLIDQACEGDEKGIADLAQWIVDTIPPEGCGYHYLSVRLMLNCRPSLFDHVYKRLGRAIMNARKHPLLAGQCGKLDGHWHFSHSPQTIFDL